MDKDTTSSAKIKVSKPDIQSFNQSPQELIDDRTGIAKMYKESIHDFRIEHQKPEIFLGAGDSIWGTPGNISLITGKPKSGKTITLSIVVAALLSGQTEIGNLKGCLPPDRDKILFVDVG